MEKILVSACLLGQKCRYDGLDNEGDYFAELNKYFDLVPFCPECVGGLPTPRPRSEIKGSQVVNENGKLVTREFEKGAQKALEVCSFLGITRAILKEDSPSCGVHFVHDGFFRNRKIEGQGITAALLKRHGIDVMNETEGKAFLESYLSYLSSKPAYKEDEAPKTRDASSFRLGKDKVFHDKLSASKRRGNFKSAGMKGRGEKEFGKFDKPRGEKKFGRKKPVKKSFPKKKD